MCGICGVIRFPGLSADDGEAVRRMTGALRHRGPDGAGFWCDSQAALGHARLAIIDLAGGYQPMFNERGDVAIVFNGEIYNFAELRRALISAGHEFRTCSDTEVIVHGYEEWGDDVVDRLRGMFAFALWDAEHRRLVVARDRMGEKPFYYYLAPDKETFYFASELKAVVACASVPRRLNSARLPEYLAFRSISGDETLFQGVKQLEPGTSMVLQAGRQSTRAYWTTTPAACATESRAALQETGERLLLDSIASRLVSEVPLGTITSGGLDSSLVTAMAIKLAGRPLDTFCVGFGEPGSIDERPYAREVARHVGSHHHEIEVTGSDVARELERLTWAHDEPLTHPNSVPMHLIFRFAKETVGTTVLLSGEGADELFGGYGWYATMLKRERLLRVPGLGRSARLFARRWPVLSKVLAPDYPLLANAVLDRSAVADLVGTSTNYLDSRRRFWPAGKGAADGLFQFDQRVYLEPLLQRQDRMSMAAGVEARVVFLDHPLVRWINGVPTSEKIRGGSRKALLKAIAARWLPQHIIHRPKVGFTLPLGSWLRSGPLARELDRIREPDAFVRSVLSGPAIDRLLGEHTAGIQDHAEPLWSLLSLNVWADVFLGPELRSRELPGVSTANPAVAAGSHR